MSDDKRDVLHISAADGYRVPRDHHPMNPKELGKPIPCPTCVCRVANRDRKTDRDAGWDEAYDSDFQREVWDGTHAPDLPDYAMRNGGLNHCHQGHAYACAGTQVVQEREVLRFHKRARSVGVDQALEESSLSREGIERVAGRMVTYGGIRNLMSMYKRWQLLGEAHPALSDPAIGHPSTEPPKPGEFDS